MYEGRTRGKRMKYTFSDDEDEFSFSENPEPRRSNRNAGLSTEPITTASGRQTRPRMGNLYGENGTAENSTARPSPSANSKSDDESDGPVPNGRATRTAA